MKLKINFLIVVLSLLTLRPSVISAQQIKNEPDSLTVSTGQASVIVHYKTGTLSYRFSNGVVLNNTVAYVKYTQEEPLYTGMCSEHQAATVPFNNESGKGVRIVVRHTGNSYGIILTQQITLYENHPYVLANLTATAVDGQKEELESRDICALDITPAYHGFLFQPGKDPRLLDVPFDNDDWVNIVERKWTPGKAGFGGISYEYASLYDNNTLSGLVMGSLSHDFWKTGISYHASQVAGLLDSLKIYDGAATPDNPALPADYGGKDGTHDQAPHGTMKGAVVNSSILYLCASSDVRKAFVGYGNANVLFNGRRTWNGNAPVYWNSFGVEGVLGYTGVMMPKDVIKISDFIQSLGNFNKYNKPVISIDSYDQSIYTTELLASFGRYAAKKDQQLGFYFIPFAIWTWKNSLDNTKIAGSDFPIRDVLLRDRNNQPIAYKDGDWGAFAMDPTHPAVRLYIINQLEKAKAIGAKFIKIDFLTAGAMESTRRYNPEVRTGLQAYNYGMSMLRSLVDSIMGKDIFITQAISPMFPHQYAHTRFISTDVYSHLRNDEKGFPNYGSTEASLAFGSHQWWVQGTLWPYTNLDVTIMKNFQKNPDLSETEVKVRLFALMTMGSILGDGSDFRNKLAADRAKIYLDNKNVCAFFANPKAFTPLNFADGDTEDQQLAFYLSGENTILSLFNFSRDRMYNRQWRRTELGLGESEYLIQDFMTDTIIARIPKGQDSFTLAVPAADAIMVRLVPVK